MQNNFELVELLKENGCGGNFRMFQIIGNDLVEGMSNEELESFEEQQKQTRSRPKIFRLS